jgi:hypothetical protein
MLKIHLKPARSGYHVCLEMWAQGGTIHVDAWLMLGDKYIKFYEHMHLSPAHIVELMQGRRVCADAGSGRLWLAPSGDGRKVRLMYRQGAIGPWYGGISLNTLTAWAVAGLVK